MRRIVGLALLATFTGAWGCQSPAPAPREREKDAEPVASTDAPIVGGSVDNGHDAVVTVLSFSDEGMGACSGTIVAKDGTSGYVLTAGHCAGDSYVVVESDDWSECIENNTLNGSAPGCGEVYQVRNAELHPDFDADADVFDTGFGVPNWDFLMLRFTGATDSTPVIPFDDGSANFAAGDDIEIVGFGRIDVGGSLQDNTQRYHVENTVEGIYSSVGGTPAPLMFWYQSFDGPGGSCQGDSGGPSLHNGYVVGVTSFGGQGCDSDGWAAHVEQASEFIEDFIAEDVPEVTCTQCAGATFANECGNQYQACIEDDACDHILGCNSSCHTQNCFDNCVEENESGFGLYQELLSCAFCEVCEDKCGDTDTCNPDRKSVV